MSQENVELVKGLQPGPDFDIARLVRDDDVNAAWVSAVTPLFHSEFECVMMSPTEGPRTYVGLDGLRAAWSDWTAPWTTYRSEVEQIIDAADRVLVLVRDFGRRQQSAQEVAFPAAAVWTVRDRKIARVEFYPDRRQALDAAGLSGRHRGPIVDSPNLDLVRSIYADWEQGDFSSAEWADPEIEYTRVGELAPAGTWKGLRRMAEGAREVLEAYEDLRIEAEEYSELDGERVFVLDRRSGRGKRSGLQIAGLGAHLFHIRAGKVTRLVDCPDRGRALADLGLEE